MADNKLVGLTNVATDELAYLNGLAQSEPLPNAQRLKLLFGTDGVGLDVHNGQPLPVEAASVVTELALLLAQLQVIATNTGNTKLDADHISIEADKIDLSTDGLEALITTLNGLVTALTTANHTDLAAILAKDEQLRALLAGTLAVDGSAHTQPISATALPLPAGAATQTTLASVLSALQATLAISATALPLPTGAATQTTLASVLSALQSTLAISASALPLPAGAATETSVSATAARLAVASPTDFPGSTGQVGSGTVLLGYTARETAGATAVFRLRKANATTGAILASVSLGPNESARDWYGPNGLDATGGIFFQTVSGTLEGGVAAR